ncbi:hypothetical protein [Roseibium sp.]|uniref:hypothetical protein n=1 Tax=Roseibium sp. TaxID=1936156 RepID=UPI003A96FFEE
MSLARRGVVILAVFVCLLPVSGVGAGLSPELVQAMRKDPARLQTMPCRGLWYLEQKVLAAGRICLRTERARRAFKSARRCISDDEAVLPAEAQDYLASVRRARLEKRCP